MSKKRDIEPSMEWALPTPKYRNLYRQRSPLAAYGEIKIMELLLVFATKPDILETSQALSYPFETSRKSISPSNNIVPFNEFPVETISGLRMGRQLHIVTVDLFKPEELEETGVQTQVVMFAKLRDVSDDTYSQVLNAVTKEANIWLEEEGSDTRIPDRPLARLPDF